VFLGDVRVTKTILIHERVLALDELKRKIPGTFIGAAYLQRHVTLAEKLVTFNATAPRRTRRCATRVGIRTILHVTAQNDQRTNASATRVDRLDIYPATVPRERTKEAMRTRPAASGIAGDSCTLYI